MEYMDLILSILLLVSAVFNGVRWFIIRKNYILSSFVVVIIQVVAAVVLLMGE